jgi:hypothetical protein
MEKREHDGRIHNDGTMVFNIFSDRNPLRNIHNAHMDKRNTGNTGIKMSYYIPNPLANNPTIQILVLYALTLALFLAILIPSLILLENLIQKHKK